MSGFFDRNDTRSAKSREASLFKNLKTIVAVATPRAAGLRAILRGAELATVERREDLARLPVLRKRDIERMRADDPPFGGLVAMRPGMLRRMTIDGPQGQVRDWWNCARALSAAGFTRDDIILNCFSYHLSASGHVVDEGAAELGCAVIPAGTARVEKKLEAIHALKPTAYCGEPEHLLQLLDHAANANCDVSSLKKAFFFGAYLSRHARAEIERRGIGARQAYVTSRHGVIAFETSLDDGRLNEGMIVNEGLIVEIVRPGTNTPAPDGEIGEVVVTRVNQDYPLLRVSTGDLSRVIPGASPCGRTGARIAGWLGRVGEETRIANRVLTPQHVLDLADRHACVRRMQIVVRREGQGDSVLLRAEGPDGDPQLPANLKRNLFDITGIEGDIEVVGAGVLDTKARLIADERR